MQVGKTEEELLIEVSGEKLNQKKECVYLGALFTAIRERTGELRRTQCEWVAMNKGGRSAVALAIK